MNIILYKIIEQCFEQWRGLWGWPRSWAWNGSGWLKMKILFSLFIIKSMIYFSQAFSAPWVGSLVAGFCNKNHQFWELFFYRDHTNTSWALGCIENETSTSPNLWCVINYVWIETHEHKLGVFNQILWR